MIYQWFFCSSMAGNVMSLGWHWLRGHASCGLERRRRGGNCSLLSQYFFVPQSITRVLWKYLCIRQLHKIYPASNHNSGISLWNVMCEEHEEVPCHAKWIAPLTWPTTGSQPLPNIASRAPPANPPVRLLCVGTEHLSCLASVMDRQPPDARFIRKQIAVEAGIERRPIAANPARFLSKIAEEN